MTGTVTFKGAPLTLVGRTLKVGSFVPDFKAVATDLTPKKLADFEGKIKVISVFPSIDTPVCDLQVKEFNKRAAGFSPDVMVIGISKDLPFAQARFCSINDITNETVLSDYQTASFGINYGLLIKELNLLARAVLIVDKNNILRYREVVPELTHAVNFEAALAALADVIKNPSKPAPDTDAGHCVPCEGGIAPLPKEKVDGLLAQHRGWELVDGKKLVKEFKFRDFKEAKSFLDLLSMIAEEQGHHPGFSLMYNKLKVTLTTHAAGGLTDNDFIMARIIDEAGG
jgi:thioredoxin-dependent peroxiredoxin